MRDERFQSFCVTLDAGTVRYARAPAGHDPNPDAPCAASGTGEAEVAPSTVLAAIGRAHTHREIAPWIPLTSVVAIYLGLTIAYTAGGDAAAMTATGAAILALAATAYLLARRFDRSRMAIRVLFHLDEQAANRFELLQAAVRTLAQAHRVWHVPTEGRARAEPRRLGARLFLRRYAIRPLVGAPATIRTNVQVPMLASERRRYLFFPDRVLVAESRAVHALAYPALAPQRREELCVEDEGLPADAAVVETTWLHATPDGAPDPQFANNKRLPIVVYGVFEFAGPGGIAEFFLVSRPGAADALVDALDSFHPSPRTAWSSPSHDGGEEGARDDTDERDGLADEALRELVRAGEASIEVLVTRLAIDAGRAARLLDELERDGFVGPVVRHRPRAIHGAAVRFVAVRFPADADNARRNRPRTPRAARRGRRLAAHEVLGVSERASREEVTDAYRNLAQQFHPDKVATLAPEFQELAELRMKEINAAYREMLRHC